MQNDIGIAVTRESPAMLDLYSAQDQRATLDQSMRIMANSDSHGGGF
jgi:hypothetical protein